MCCIAGCSEVARLLQVAHSNIDALRWQRPRTVHKERFLAAPGASAPRMSWHIELRVTLRDFSDPFERVRWRDLVAWRAVPVSVMARAELSLICSKGADQHMSSFCFAHRASEPTSSHDYPLLEAVFIFSRQPGWPERLIGVSWLLAAQILEWRSIDAPDRVWCVGTGGEATRSSDKQTGSGMREGWGRVRRACSCERAASAPPRSLSSLCAMDSFSSAPHPLQQSRSRNCSLTWQQHCRLPRLATPALFWSVPCASPLHSHQVASASCQAAQG